MMKKIGILGGAFDPPHLGHIQIAKEVKAHFQLDEIWFIPTYKAPHKDESTTRAGDRAEMVRLAIKSYESFLLKTIELERKGRSYTIDTMKQLKKDFPTYQFYFIIGADLVMSLHTWKEIDELIHLVTFIGVSRPGYTLTTELPVKFIELNTYDIASSEIRSRIREGLPWKHLVSSSVYDYVKEHQLYGYNGGT